MLAAAQTLHLAGKLVLYVADNGNAESCLLKRVAKNRLARHGLRLPQLLETRHGFQVTAAGA